MTPRRLDDAELRRLTNLEQLVGARVDEEIPVVPSAPPFEAPDMTKRSTTDPLQSNFGNVDLVEGLGKKQVKRSARWFAWIFLAGPLLLAWPFIMHDIFVDPGAGPIARVGLLWQLGEALVITAFCGFWPYILLRGPQK
jgi:hypothetical protein